MREIRTYGSARGVPGNRHSYRNNGIEMSGRRPYGTHYQRGLRWIYGRFTIRRRR